MCVWDFSFAETHNFCKRADRQRDLLNIDIEGSEIKRNYMPCDRQSLYLKMWKISFSLLETLLLITLLAGKMAIGHRRGGGGGGVQQ